MTIKPGKSEWTFLGEAIKVITFPLLRQVFAENIFLYDKELLETWQNSDPGSTRPSPDDVYGTYPLSFVNVISFNFVGKDSGDLILDFENCEQRGNFEKILPPGSDLEFGFKYEEDSEYSSFYFSDTSYQKVVKLDDSNNRLRIRMNFVSRNDSDEDTEDINLEEYLESLIPEDHTWDRCVVDNACYADENETSYNYPTYYLKFKTLGDHFKYS